MPTVQIISGRVHARQRSPGQEDATEAPRRPSDVISPKGQRQFQRDDFVDREGAGPWVATKVCRRLKEVTIPNRQWRKQGWWAGERQGRGAV